MMKIALVCFYIQYVSSLKNCDVYNHEYLTQTQIYNRLHAVLFYPKHVKCQSGN